jgi:hypothetical protein
MIEMFTSKILFQNGGYVLSTTSFLPGISGSLHRLLPGFFPKDRLFSLKKSEPSFYQAIVHEYKIKRDSEQTGFFTGMGIKPADNGTKTEYRLLE